MKQPTIDLHIRELLLRNLPYGQRYQIAGAVEQALIRLLNERGLPPALARGGTIPHLGIDHLQITAGAQADVVGNQIAQAIYSSLTGAMPMD
jgi:hypothetical protein